MFQSFSFRVNFKDLYVDLYLKHCCVGYVFHQNGPNNLMKFPIFQDFLPFSSKIESTKIIFSTCHLTSFCRILFGT